MTLTVGTVRPYPHSGLPDVAAWIRDVPVEWVAWEDVTTTQDGVYIRAVLDPEPVRDEYPHVIRYAGRLYLEDGHTRMVRSILRGNDGALCRVRNVPRGSQ